MAACNGHERNGPNCCLPAVFQGCRRVNCVLGWREMRAFVCEQPYSRHRCCCLTLLAGLNTVACRTQSTAVVAATRWLVCVVLWAEQQMDHWWNVVIVP